jgi:hypothetical protein
MSRLLTLPVEVQREIWKFVFEGALFKLRKMTKDIGDTLTREFMDGSFYYTHLEPGCSDFEYDVGWTWSIQAERIPRIDGIYWELNPKSQVL